MSRKIIVPFIAASILGCITTILMIPEKEETPLEQKKIVIVVPSYNNSQWYVKNLDSIFAQKYYRYRVIYIDDCSTDNTYELVKDYVEQHGHSDRFTIIRNTIRHTAVGNHFKAGHMCDDDEIIVHLDGDDWFPHDRVLQRVNKAYTDPNVWMTYGQFEIYPGSVVGWCRDIPAVIHEKNLYRNYEWVTSHLRTFYAWLFKEIKMKDCLYNSSWIPVAYDIAFTLPLLEMSREHTQFIPDVLYVYNCATPSNDHKLHLLEQQHFNRLLRSKKKYAKIKESPLNVPQKKSQQTAMVIFSENNPLHAQALLKSLQKHTEGINTTYVLYDAMNQNYYQAYQKLQKQFPSVIFKQYNKAPQSILSHTLHNILTKNDFILFSRDGIILTDRINIHDCTAMLNKTKAYGFYLALGKNITHNPRIHGSLRQPRFVDFDNHISAWQFSCGHYDWRQPHTLSLALYRTSDIQKALAGIRYDKTETLEKMWASAPFEMDNIGLIFEHAPAYIIESTIKQEKLCDLFNRGFKIDLEEISVADNQSCSQLSSLPLTTKTELA